VSDDFVVIRETMVVVGSFEPIRDAVQEEGSVDSFPGNLLSPKSLRNELLRSVCRELCSQSIVSDVSRRQLPPGVP
jgi:hypothetical protein